MTSCVIPRGHHYVRMEEVLLPEDPESEPHSHDAVHAIVAISICLLVPGLVLPVIIKLIRRIDWRGQGQHVPLPASPPPLSRLGEEEEHFHDATPGSAWTKETEIFRVRTPRSGTATPPSPHGRPHTANTATARSPAKSTLSPLARGGLPRSSIRQPGSGHTHEMTSVPHSQRTAQPLVSPIPPTGGRRALHTLFSPIKSQPQAQGWDPALLASCAAMDSEIGSLEGLVRTQEFQAHVRERHGNLDLTLAQTDAKLNMYREVRDQDRDMFMTGLSRRDMKDYESVPAARWLLVLDQLTSAAAAMGIVVLCARAALAGQGSVLSGWGWSPAAAWLAVNAGLAWVHSHPSILGEVLCLYTVYWDERYQDHQVAAGLWRTAAAALLDAAFAPITLCMSAVVSAVLVLTTQQRQSLGQRLCKVQVVAERTVKAAVPLFSPSRKTPPVQHVPASSAGSGRTRARTGVDMGHSTGLRSRQLAYTPPTNEGLDGNGCGRHPLPPDGQVVFGLRPSLYNTPGSTLTGRRGY